MGLVNGISSMWIVKSMHMHTDRHDCMSERCAKALPSGGLLG